MRKAETHRSVCKSPNLQLSPSVFLLSPSWTLSAGQKGPGVPLLVVVQSLSHVRLIVTPWTAARRAQRPLWSSRIVIWKIFNRWGRLSLSNASAFPQVPEKSVLALPLPSRSTQESAWCPSPAPHTSSPDISAVRQRMTLVTWLRSHEWHHTVYSIPPPLSALTLMRHNLPKSVHLSPCEAPYKASPLVLFPKLSGWKEPVSPSCFFQSLLEFWWMYFFLPC